MFHKARLLLLPLNFTLILNYVVPDSLHALVSDQNRFVQ
jgi:hypothetical protein